jgi:hypothetical protein
MTKRDYELIAEVVKDLRNLSLVPDFEVNPQVIAQTFADRLAKTNPRFDRAKFLRACGVTS